MKKIVIGDIVSRAWDLAVKHWPIFVLLTIVNSIVSGIGVNIDTELYLQAIQSNSPELISEALHMNGFLAAVGFLLAIYLGYVVLNLYVNAYTIGRPYQTMADAFKVDFNQLAIYFAVEACYALLVGIATCLCILPGIWVGVRLVYAPMLAATQGASFGDAFRRSWEMTKGNFWDLFLLGLTALGIAILGFCACCVGYYFAAVVIEFMLVISFFALMPNQTTGEPTDYVEAL